MKVYREINAKEIKAKKQLYRDKPIKYYHNNSKRRSYGYFIEKSLENNDSLSVRNKYIGVKGFLWNNANIENIVTYFIIEFKKENSVTNEHKRFKNIEQYFQFLLSTNENFENFKHCMKDIKKDNL